METRKNETSVRFRNLRGLVARLRDSALSAFGRRRSDSAQLDVSAVQSTEGRNVGGAMPIRRGVLNVLVGAARRCATAFAGRAVAVRGVADQPARPALFAQMLVADSAGQSGAGSDGNLGGNGGTGSQPLAAGGKEMTDQTTPFSLVTPPVPAVASTDVSAAPSDAPVVPVVPATPSPSATLRDFELQTAAVAGNVLQTAAVVAPIAAAADPRLAPAAAAVMDLTPIAIQAMQQFQEYAMAGVISQADLAGLWQSVSANVVAAHNAWVAKGA